MYELEQKAYIFGMILLYRTGCRYLEMNLIITLLLNNGFLS